MLPDGSDEAVAASDPASLARQWESDLATLGEGTEGTIGTMTLAEAADRLARDHDLLEPVGMEAELRDRVWIAMTNAVIDIETLASETDLSLSPTDLRDRLEGETPMTIEEYAHVRYAIAAREA